jgi:hypothetical protein
VDADGGVQAEPAGPLPGEHVIGRVRIEEAAALEEAEDAALEEGREGGCVIGGEVGRLVEADVAVSDLGEDAVEDHDVEVEVEGAAKRWRKETAPSWASGPAPGLPRRSAVRTARSRIWSTAPARAGS